MVERGWRGLYVIVSGNIGTGKTTLCKGLAKFFNYRCLLEPAKQNPFLDDYYSDMRRWAFHSQVFFAAEFLRTHRRISEIRGPVCQDRSLFDSLVFAKSLWRLKILSEREYILLRALLDQMLSVLSIRQPDVIVYLEAPLPILLTRVQSRGVNSEQAITEEYLEVLQHAYERWVSEMIAIPVVRIDSDRINFLERGGVEYVLSSIYKRIGA